MRNDFASSPAIALRLMVAHAIVGLPLWRVDVEPQQARSESIAESVETCLSETLFDKKRRAVLALLGFDAECPTVISGYDGDHGLAGLYARLLQLSDETVLEVLAVVMAETLAVDSDVIEVLGPLLGTDMAKVWQADDALLDGIRDRELLGVILADVACESVAVESERATGKVKRQIVRDCLAQTDARRSTAGCQVDGFPGIQLHCAWRGAEPLSLKVMSGLRRDHPSFAKPLSCAVGERRNQIRQESCQTTFAPAMRFAVSHQALRTARRSPLESGMSRFPYKHLTETAPYPGRQNKLVDRA